MRGNTVQSICITGRRHKKLFDLFQPTLLNRNTGAQSHFKHTAHTHFFQAPDGPYNPKWTANVTVITHKAQDQQLDHGRHMTCSFSKYRGDDIL